MKPRLFALAATLFLLPLGLKLGIPALAHHTPLAQTQSGKEYLVDAVEGYTLRIHGTGQPQTSVKLAGLQSTSQVWQNQAASVTTLLLSSSQGRITLIDLPASVRDGTRQAIAQLPNGTSIQQILLADGLTKLDRDRLSQLPTDLALALQQAEASARSQHKNLWGVP